MSRPLPADPDLARYMDAEARRTTGLRQDLGTSPEPAPGSMNVAAIIADCLQPALEPNDAETMAERIVAALDAAARATPERQYAVHDVVQISPEVDGFGGCLLLVTKVKTWGVIGFVQVPCGGQAYYRVNFDKIEHTGGRAVWAPPVETDGEGA